ncbi:MAG: phosphoribosylformylglycinamidine synthase [Bdellovibrionales bacterium]|nr:phosphoribosylformylglycinamidine synthase [Bdellovibrionales bacterium]
MSVVRIEVRDRSGNPREHRLARNARQNLRVPVFAAEAVDVFWVKCGDGAPIEDSTARAWAGKIFSDPILHEVALGQEAEFRPLPSLSLTPTWVVEVRFLPGVTDNVGNSATDALRLVSDFARDHAARVFSGKDVYLYGDLSRDEAERVALESLANPLIEDIRVKNLSEFLAADRFSGQEVPEVRLAGDTTVEAISLDADDRALEKLSRERCWALSLPELQVIREYFARPEVRHFRAAEGLGPEPTDVEMEVLAQTWSEHCKHKIFAAEIDYKESVQELAPVYPSLGAFTVKSVFKSYIRGATEEVKEKRKLDWLVSVFTDNAGVVRFDPKVDVCIKVETHNSPSALDPYGGALTGIVGVNRDVLGCGLGARPIANTDVFCFAPPDWQADELPGGLKHPRRIFDGVHQGVEDGGNKSGIPTVNGAIVFHRNYAGKPLVFCGTLGAMPRETAGRPSSSKNQKPGDFVVMAGGRIGKDGIHGATFSSMELNEGAPATVVQIGDPITQKRLADFLLEARDQGLYTSVTDNGAGGLSSSVGEMAQGAGGATMDVALAPVKYAGLRPYELTVSESQERMTFAVDPGKWSEFEALARRRGVEVSKLGEFRSDGKFRVQHAGKTVACLDLDFLHDGLPPMVLKAEWEGPKEDRPFGKEEPREPVTETQMQSRAFLERALYRLLARWNVRSKEPWVRHYDHEVQAATVIKPFTGVRADGPGDAAVVWMAPHGGSERGGVAVSCGLAPKLAHLDTYVAAQHALDEAVRNAVATGADPDRMAVVDNFCWPDPIPSEKNPDAAHKLAQLVRANHGLRDLAIAYGTPFVSGKDSMKNDFLGKSRFGKDIKISVPPTVLVTAIGHVPDVARTVTTDFKKAGHRVFLVGKPSRHLGGSELLLEFHLPETRESVLPPPVEGASQMRLYRKIHQAIQAGWLESCHDCSEGGAAVAIAESALGGDLGVVVDVHSIQKEILAYGGAVAEFLFNEAPGRFVVSVAQENVGEFQRIFEKETVIPFGEVVDNGIFRVMRSGLVLLDCAVGDLRAAWKGERK